MHRSTFQRFGTFKQSVAAWEEGKFYNAKPVGTYLLAAAHVLEGEKAKAFDVVQRQIAAEELQARSGRAPLGELNPGEMDLVSRIGLEFDKMAAQELTTLKSFLKLLSEEEVPWLRVTSDRIPSTLRKAFQIAT